MVDNSGVNNQTKADVIREAGFTLDSSVQCKKDDIEPINNGDKKLKDANQYARDNGVTS